jgi:undecaprenyl-diphosphatase
VSLGLVPARLGRVLAPLVAIELALVGVLGALVWHSTHGNRFDSAVARSLYAGPGSFVRSVASVVTIFGAAGFVVPATALVTVWAWFLFRDRDRRLVLFAPIAVLVPFLAGRVLKSAVHRQRPSTSTLLREINASFPSGHATSSAALALTVSLLLVAAAVSWRRPAIVALAAYAFAVSLSRLVLGVHYLTDVVGGICLGGAGVLSCAWLFSRGGGRESNPPDGDRPSHPL